MKFNLDNFSILKITGKDAQSFLQSQLTNDISKIKNSEVQLNAYCQHQGKIICLVYVIKEEAFFYLFLNIELKTKLVETFYKYKFLSDIEIIDLTGKLHLNSSTSSSEKLDYKFNKNVSFSLTTERKDYMNSLDLWNFECFKYNLPEIYLNTSEVFTPEQINIDTDEIGVSFKKGCYPGQEVVARMHYLGKAKKRMLRFVSNSEVFSGDKLYAESSSSLKGSGQVVRVARIENKFYFLASIDSSKLLEEIKLSSFSGPKVSIYNES